jgi:hypothetical protein
MEMIITHNLAEAWNKYISSGNAFSDFTAGYDDPQGNWKQGDTIRVGLELSDNKPRYFARNLTSGADIRYNIASEQIAEGFWKSFNPYRCLRPKPLVKRKAGVLDAPSELAAECGFKCDDPKHPWSLLSRDPVNVLLMPGGYWASYYNFSPFEAEGHFLLLPVRVRGNLLVLPHFPQRLTREFLADGISLFAAGEGLLFLFNSLHAGASQNHFHFQAVAATQKYAITRHQPPSGSYAPLENYPIRGLAISIECPLDTIYGFIRRLEAASVPFNLVMTGKAIYLMPRKAECEIVEEFPYGVLASIEMAGRLILSDMANYRDTNYEKVCSAFSKISLSESEFHSVLGV